MEQSRNEDPAAVRSIVSDTEQTSKIALILEYDGTRFCGFQYQDVVPTVQDDLEEAIAKLTGERRRVLGASRTDAGVHAWGQVVSFRTRADYRPEVFVSGLNHYLPDDIAVREAYRVREEFNVKRQAVSREYEYHILNCRTRSALRKGRVHLVPGSLDLEMMNRASQELEGSHDFASFVTRYEKGSTRRTVHKAAFEKLGGLVIFHMVANSFLAHQVRNTVGALIQIGLGKLCVDHIRYLLESKSPGMAGPTAPAHGLYLMKVNYPQPLGAM